MEKQCKKISTRFSTPGIVGWVTSNNILKVPIPTPPRILVGSIDIAENSVLCLYLRKYRFQDKKCEYKNCLKLNF